MDVMWQELGALYADGALDGRWSERQNLVEPTLQYVDYVYWQRSLLESGVLDAQRRFWREQLQDGNVPVLKVPIDKPRPPMRTANGDAGPGHIAADLVGALDALATAHGCSFFQVLLTVWGVLLCQQSGQEDVIVGVPYHGRDTPALAGMVGNFTNILCMRLVLPITASLESLLAGVRTT